jgi:hypothetical protein
VRFSRYYVPEDAKFTGLVNDCDDISCQAFATSANYRLGVMAALNAVRNIVLESSYFSELADSPYLDTYFARRKEILGLIDAAVGPGVSVRHGLNSDNAWTVDVRVPDADVAWWRENGDREDTGSVYHDVYAVRGSRAANAAVAPHMTWAARTPDGIPVSECLQCSTSHPYTLADAIALADSKGWVGEGAGFSLEGGDPDDDEKLWTGHVHFPNEPGGPVSTALLVRRTENAPSGPVRTYRFLGGNVTIPNIFNDSMGGQYWAWGGTLGEFARKQSQGRGAIHPYPPYVRFGNPTN